MTKEEKLIKQRDKKDKINAAISKIPFPICYYTEVIIKAELIETTDLELQCYDNFFRQLIEEKTDPYILNKAISYVSNNIIRNEWKDGRGFPITNKYTYFRNAVISGIRRQLAKVKWIDD